METGVLVRFASYNPHDLFKKTTAEAVARQDMVYEVIRGLGADVVAVQEIVGDPAMAGGLLRQVAEAVGLRCEYGPGQAAVAPGGNGYHTGLLWREGITPVPGSWRAYGANDFWHSMAKVALDVGGPVVQHGVFHARPFGRELRNGEAERVVSNMTRPRQTRPPGLVGADWNGLAAERLPDGSYYDTDPYAPLPWRSANVYQCVWDYDANGQRINWRADRTAGDILWAGGLYDAAPALRAPWQATAGHFIGEDPFGSRRIDAIRVTADMLPALVSHHVVDTDLSRKASDHLPVLVAYDTEHIGARPSAHD